MKTSQTNKASSSPRKRKKVIKSRFARTVNHLAALRRLLTAISLWLPQALKVSVTWPAEMIVIIIATCQMMTLICSRSSRSSQEVSASKIPRHRSRTLCRVGVSFMKKTKSSNRGQPRQRKRFSVLGRSKLGVVELLTRSHSLPVIKVSTMGQARHLTMKNILRRYMMTAYWTTKTSRSQTTNQRRIKIGSQM